MDEPNTLVRVDPIHRTRREPSKAGSQDNRVHNRALILRTLYTGNPMSRSDLARASKLTRPTVSALIATLLEDGLVSEIGPRVEPRVGKPATLIALNDNGAGIVALDLSHDRSATGAIVNLRGEIVARHSIDMAHLSGEQAYHQVAALVDLLFQATDMPILGIGAGSPGLVDDQGVVRYGTHRHWIDFPLASRLAQQFQVPAHVGNDINTAALGALHFRDINARDLIMLSIGDAIGMGLVVAGTIVEGEHFAAGEIGHVTISEAGDTCVCGRPGCLEVYISNARSAIRSSSNPQQRREAIAAAGHALGILVAPIATALNLSTVIVTGSSDIVTDTLVATATKTIASHSIPIINANVEVIAMPGDDDLILLGATSRVLRRELEVL